MRAGDRSARAGAQANGSERWTICIIARGATAARLRAPLASYPAPAPARSARALELAKETKTNQREKGCMATTKDVAHRIRLQASPRPPASRRFGTAVPREPLRRFSDGKRLSHSCQALSHRPMARSDIVARGEICWHSSSQGRASLDEAAYA